MIPNGGSLTLVCQTQNASQFWDVAENLAAEAPCIINTSPAFAKLADNIVKHDIIIIRHTLC